MLSRTSLGMLSHARLFSTRSIRNPLPAWFLRGGTSKGIFLNEADLPQDRAEWDPIFRGIMGSPDAEYGRQLNGMGGGVSSLSKICVIGRPSARQEAQGVDVTYTFAQIGIRDSEVDYSGNCGNLSSMVGVYALDNGLCQARLNHDTKEPTATVRFYNTNTDKVIETTFPVFTESDNTVIPLLDSPQATIAGVPGKASKIVLDFVQPGGARTGKLLPTAEPETGLTLEYDDKLYPISVSLVDATNPTVFTTLSEFQTLTKSALSSDLRGLDANIFNNPAVLALLDRVRTAGAIAMGLDPNAQAQPKIAILDSPSQADIDAGIDLSVLALSMGVPHKAIPMTVGLCLGVACGIEGTNASTIVQESRRRRGGKVVDLGREFLVTMKHPGGLVDVGAKFGVNGEALSASVVRTGRRLMKGHVWW